MKYSDIFNRYRTKEGKLFNLINKSINFPEDKSLPIYDKETITDNIPWTVLSYKIYDKIDYWWILCSINRSSIFYAKEGDTIFYVKPEYLDFILTNLR